ncbi:MAG: molybdenum cofactor biosynthesis protein MoaE [Proteobacteria bacterium]|jgi:molybdopterin synthase catalytic subunit|nr:molybdenum cofactor biosynthesis protein MoaE [Pseudomonadota bacterium]MDA0941544.1 molybdenum cofactor biosynthesis protein MoaE [Pseudomonadota bacterium]MDA1034948.1 molybdenum cofactor biosynthesis protein MoaE [Pseudomonadota bacterium]
MSVIVQESDFSLQQVIEELRKNPNTGAVLSFIGYVRNFTNITKDIEKKNESFMEIEHYPAMTEKSLMAIESKTRLKWQVSDVRIIHRYGKLEINDQIVLVAVSSEHRKEAFMACEYIIDYLKTDAPFWKKEFDGEVSRWVNVNIDDIEKRNKW